MDRVRAALRFRFGDFAALSGVALGPDRFTPRAPLSPAVVRALLDVPPQRLPAYLSGDVHVPASSLPALHAELGAWFGAPADDVGPLRDLIFHSPTVTLLDAVARSDPPVCPEHCAATFVASPFIVPGGNLDRLLYAL